MKFNVETKQAGNPVHLSYLLVVYYDKSILEWNYSEGVIIIYKTLAPSIVELLKLDLIGIEPIWEDHKSSILPLNYKPIIAGTHRNWTGNSCLQGKYISVILASHFNTTEEAGIESALVILETTILPLNYSSGKQQNRGEIESPFTDLQSAVLPLYDLFKLI